MWLMRGAALLEPAFNICLYLCFKFVNALDIAPVPRIYLHVNAR
jgi:hypothetical protein